MSATTSPRVTRSSAARASKSFSANLQSEDEALLPVTQRVVKRRADLRDEDFDASGNDASQTVLDEPAPKRRKPQNPKSKGDALKLHMRLFGSERMTTQQACVPPTRHHDLDYHRSLLLDDAFSRQALLKWFDGVSARRSMPWRQEWINPQDHKLHENLRDLLERRAYQVWISEIMLQQTRVAVVIDYWNRWMSRWPTIHNLAAASADDVLSAWRGLGYYSRATRIHEAAKLAVRDPDMKGLLPRRVEVLESKIPGVGRYTAGAISAIVFGRAAPMVDGNVLRVLSRQLGVFSNVKTSKLIIDMLWAAADALVKAIAKDGTQVQDSEGVETSDRPGRWGQALMELGSTICTPKPICAECPITSTCRAYAEGRTLFNSDEKPKMKDIEDMCSLCESFEEMSTTEGDGKAQTTGLTQSAKPNERIKPTALRDKQLTLSAFAFKGATSDKTSSTNNKSTTSSQEMEIIVDHARKFPLKVIKKAVRTEETLVCAIQRGDGQYLVQKRPEKGLLAGLWEFPSYILRDPVEGNTAAKRKSRAASFVSKLLIEHGDDEAATLRPKHVGELGSVPWLFSHLRLTMHVQLFNLQQADCLLEIEAKDNRLKWASSEAVEQESMGTGMRKCWALVEEQGE